MNIKAFTREERAEYLKQLGQPKFREKQIFEWICRGAASAEEMSNLPASLRQQLDMESAEIELEQLSKSDGTRKFLLRFTDGNTAEAVFMKYDYGNSLCLSTQIGCNMGCSFCASTIGGKIRDLKAWEILDEYIVIRKHVGEDINHIVLMGMGEPLDNYEEVSAFLKLMHDPDGIGLSYRNMTLSTCGIVPGIERLGDEFPQLSLAISLHASNQEKRAALMPVAKRWSIDELIAVCRRHSEKTGRRITFEYTLIRGKNDSPADAAELAGLLSGMLCHVNLIPLNPVKETGMQGADRQAAKEFAERLERLGIPATVRRELGRDIDAACGQLRKKTLV